MSSEEKNKNQLEILKIDDKNITTKVDINTLMSRIREEEKKKSNETLIFLSLISSVLVATGIIASL